MQELGKGLSLLWSHVSKVKSAFWCFFFKGGSQWVSQWQGQGCPQTVPGTTKTFSHNSMPEWNYLCALLKIICWNNCHKFKKCKYLCFRKVPLLDMNFHSLGNPQCSCLPRKQMQNKPPPWQEKNYIKYHQIVWYSMAWVANKHILLSYSKYTLENIKAFNDFANQVNHHVAHLVPHFYGLPEWMPGEAWLWKNIK